MELASESLNLELLVTTRPLLRSILRTFEFHCIIPPLPPECFGIFIDPSEIP